MVKAGLLISHEETDVHPVEPAQSFKVIQPEYLPFISYPYEWSFGLLKEAALKTLSIQKRALKAGMTLKDASAYNMQFVRGKAVLIDTLSFDIYNEGEPWVAYRQFCQHFLAPLALMAHTDIRLSQLLRVYIDGIPLDLASRLLPYRSRLNFGLVTHIHFHARLQKQAANPTEQRNSNAGRMTKQGMLGLIEKSKIYCEEIGMEACGYGMGRVLSNYQLF